MKLDMTNEILDINLLIVRKHALGFNPKDIEKCVREIIRHSKALRRIGYKEVKSRIREMKYDHTKIKMYESKTQKLLG